MPDYEIFPGFPVTEGSHMFREDVARYPQAPCSHCRVGQYKGARTVWVRPQCHPTHGYKRSAAKGGPISILCVRCARQLYDYDEEKGLTVMPTLSPQEEPLEGDS